MTTTGAVSPTSGTHDPDCTPQADSRAIATDTAAAVATALRALAEPLRLRMLSFIATAPAGEACVCDLAALTEVSQPTVSHHLKVLRDVGVLTSERRGTWVWYRIEPGYRGPVSTLLDSFAPAALEAPHRQDVLGGLDDVDPVLDRMARELATAFPGVPSDVVQKIVRESYTSLARTAKAPGHLVSLAERFARQRLADTTRDTATSVPQVLFVCVANAGRSQLAAALMQHYAGDRITVRSAGSTPAADVHTGVRDALAELGTTDAFPKPLTDDAIRAADVVITMGCGDVCPILPGVRYEDWLVGDPALASPAGITAIRDDIDTRIRALIRELLPDLTLPPT
jgi:arsenate reductase